ncbi:hypothetical protein ACFQ9X_30475 [Catenulispora yoronensis]
MKSAAKGTITGAKQKAAARVGQIAAKVASNIKVAVQTAQIAAFSPAAALQGATIASAIVAAAAGRRRCFRRTSIPGAVASTCRRSSGTRQQSSDRSRGAGRCSGGTVTVASMTKLPRCASWRC